MGRKEDLEQNIRNSYTLIQEFEVIIQTSSDPTEKARVQRGVEEQWELIQGWRDEHLKICRGLSEPIPADIAEITARFGPTPIAIKHHPLFSLPPLPKGFIGREAETSALLEVLEDPNRTVIWIGGIGGIGKTYLAAWLHQEVNDRYDHQALWIDCRTRSITLEIILDALTEVSGDPELLQLIENPSVSLVERVEQVLQRYVEPEKVALFLDDYHRISDLEERYRLDEFVIQIAARCRQSKLFLIGRVRPTVLDDSRLRAAVFEYELGGLAEKCTREYLGIPDLTDEQASKIWQKCAQGTPIAMQIFSTAARRRPLSKLLALPLWDIAETRSQWLDVIVEDLTPSELACLQAASVFPAHILFEALNYVYVGGDPHLATAGLQDRALLYHKLGSDSWSTRHDTIREYVREERIAPVVRNELERRLAEYYARFVLENHQNPRQLQRESANILGAMDWCRRKQHGASITMVSLLQTLIGLEESAALQVTYDIGELAYRSGDLKRAGGLFDEVCDSARIKNYPMLLAKALTQLARLARVEGNKQLAMSRLEEAIGIGRVVVEPDWETLAVACQLLGGLLMSEGISRYALAERYLLEGLPLAKRSKHYSTVAKILNSLVFLYGDEFEKAYSLYCKERENLSGTPLAILLAGIVPNLTEVGRFDEAWRCIQEARHIYEERNSIGGVAYTWHLQGIWYWKQGELELAEESFQEDERLRSLAVEENGKAVYNLREALWGHFWFYLHTDQLDKARECRARYQATLPEPDWIIPQMLGHEAAALIAQGSYQRASRRCREAMAIYQEHGNLGGSAWIKRIQGDGLAAQGKLEEALQLYEEGLELRSHLDEANYTAEDLEHLAEFYLRQMQDFEQARRYLELARQEYQLVDVQKASAIDHRLRLLKN